MVRTLEFSWRPGIGDPTIGGWVTVVLYILACLSCWRTGGAVRFRERVVGQESHAWLATALLFALLGVNKQLDLQTALTEFGRNPCVFGGLVRAAPNRSGGFHYWCGSFMRRRYPSVACVGKNVAISDLAGARRTYSGARVCFDPRCFISSYRSLYWRSHLGSQMELGIGDEWNRHCSAGERMAPGQPPCED